MPRRVLYLAWAPFFSGAERALLLTLRSLDPARYAPYVLAGTEGEFAAQVRALDTLGRHRLSDRQSLDELARLFPVARSVDVQRAIAAAFIRSDYQLLPKSEMVSMLSEYRLKSTGGTDAIDILLRRLRAP